MYLFTSSFCTSTINENSRLILCISFISGTHLTPRYSRSVWTEVSLLPITIAPILPVQELLPLLMKLTISSGIYFYYTNIWIDFVLQMQSLSNFTQTRHELLFRGTVANRGLKTEITKVLNEGWWVLAAEEVNTQQNKWFLQQQNISSSSTEVLGWDFYF